MKGQDEWRGINGRDEEMMKKRNDLSSCCRETGETRGWRKRKRVRNERLRDPMNDETVSWKQRENKKREKRGEEKESGNEWNPQRKRVRIRQQLQQFYSCMMLLPVVEGRMKERKKREEEAEKRRTWTYEEAKYKCGKISLSGNKRLQPLNRVTPLPSSG